MAGSDTSDLDKLVGLTEAWADSRKQQLNQQLAAQENLSKSLGGGLLDGLVAKAKELVDKDLDELLS